MWNCGKTWCKDTDCVLAILHAFLTTSSNYKQFKTNYTNVNLLLTLKLESCIHTPSALSEEFVSKTEKKKNHPEVWPDRHAISLESPCRATVQTTPLWPFLMLLAKTEPTQALTRRWHGLTARGGLQLFLGKRQLVSICKWVNVWKASVKHSKSANMCHHLLQVLVRSTTPPYINDWCDLREAIMTDVNRWFCS